MNKRETVIKEVLDELNKATTTEEKKIKILGDFAENMYTQGYVDGEVDGYREGFAEGEETNQYI